MFGWGPLEIIAVLAIVLLIFGSKRIGSFGADLGRAIKGFRSAVKSDPEKDARTERVIDGESKETDTDKASS